MLQLLFRLLAGRLLCPSLPAEMCLNPTIGQHIPGQTTSLVIDNPIPLILDRKPSQRPRQLNPSIRQHDV